MTAGLRSNIRFIPRIKYVKNTLFQLTGTSCRWHLTFPYKAIVTTFAVWVMCPVQLPFNIRTGLPAMG